MIAPRDVRFTSTWLHWIFYTIGFLLFLISFLAGVAMGIPDGLPFMGFPLLVIGLMIYTKTHKTYLEFHSIQLGSQEEILHIEKNIKLRYDRPQITTKDAILNNVIFTNQRVFVLAVNTIREIFDFCSAGEDEIRLVSLTQAVDPHAVWVEPACIVLKPSPLESGVEIRIFPRDLDKVLEILEIWKRNYQE